ncbi:beta strand repeat-containing protein [Halarchaeum sp. P4]|uniref:beta strand repeat-containing protein n=1 Tax=Halarchaeum sp. P4 TaxID=3421639 RepID=UPI003EBE51E2
MTRARSVLLTALLVTSVVAGSVAFSGGAAGADFTVTIGDTHVQSGTNVTATVSGLDTSSGANLTVSITDYTTGETTQVADFTPENSTVNVTYVPSESMAGQGWYGLKVSYGMQGSSTNYGEVDDTPPNTGVTVNNTGQTLDVSVAAWDDVDTTVSGSLVEHEELSVLRVDVTGPTNATLSLAAGNFTADTSDYQNRSFYNTTLDVGEDGVYNVTVREAADYANNTVTNTTRSKYVLDTKVPVVENLTSHDDDRDGIVDDGDTVTVEATVTERFPRTVAVNASALGAGVVNLTTTETVNESHQTATYTATVTVDEANASADGSYALPVVVTDAGDHRVTTNTSTYSLDTHAPTFGAHTPSAAYVNDSTRKLTLDVSDRNAVTGHVTVASDGATLADGSFANATGTTFADGTLTVDPSAFGGLPDGTTTVNVTARDPEANTNTTSWSFVVDTHAPVLTNTSVVDADDGDTVVAANDTVRVRAHATDNTSTTVTADLSAFGAGTLTLADAGNGTYVGTANVTGGSDGPHPVTVTATDAADNRNLSTHTLTLDTAAPTATVETPANGTYTNDSTPPLTAHVADPTLDAVGVHLAESDGNASDTRLDGVWAASALADGVALADGTTIALTNETLTVSLGDRSLADGPATVRVNATDAEGHASADVHGLVVDTHAPTVSDVHVAEAGENGVVAPGNTVTVVATVTDNTSTTVTADLSAFGGATNATLTADNDSATYTANVTVSGVPDGNASATVTAVDAAGNAERATTETVTVDSDAPRFGTLTPDVRYLDTATPTVSLTVDPVDNALDANATRVVVANDTATHLNATLANASALTYVDGTLAANLSVATVTLPEGDVTVTVAAADVDGNANATSRTYTVDTVAPAVDATVSGPNGRTVVTDGDTVTVAATVDEANVGTVYVDAPALGVEQVPLTRTTNGNYTGTATVNVSRTTDESVPVSVVATDEAGHRSSAVRSLTLDTTPPAAVSDVRVGPIAADNTSVHNVTVTLPTVHEPMDVTVQLNGTTASVTKTVTVDANVTVTGFVMNASPLSDGPVAVEARTTDVAGNTDGFVPVTTVQKDTVAPSVASANGAAGSAQVFVATSEPMMNVTSTTLTVGTATVTNVTERAPDFYVAHLAAPLDAGALGNATVSLAPDATDLAGNPAVGTGATLHAGATAVRRSAAEVGTRNVTLHFDGAVTAADGSPLTAANVTYRDANGAGATDVVAVHGTANDTTVTLELDAPVVPADLGADSVHLPGGEVLNAEGQSIGDETVAVADTTPATIHSFEASTTNTTVSVSVAANEPLRVVRVRLDAAHTRDGATFSRDAGTLTERYANGTYTYTGTFEAPDDDRYTATLATALDYGNHSVGADRNVTAAVDTERPHATIAEITAVRNNTTTVRVAFNEPTDFAALDASNVTLSGTPLAVTNVTATDATTLAVTVDGRLNTAGEPTLTVEPDTVVEATGDGSTNPGLNTTVYALVRHVRAGSTFLSVPMESGTVELAAMNLTGVQAVWTYDEGEWQAYDPDAPRNDFDALVGGQGYVFVTDRARTFSFAVNNAVPESEADTRTLEAGWNLVGPWQETPMTANATLAGVPGNVTAVHGHAGGFTYDAVNTTDVLDPGHGYWVYTPNETTYRPVPAPTTGGGVDA